MSLRNICFCYNINTFQPGEVLATLCINAAAQRIKHSSPTSHVFLLSQGLLTIHPEARELPHKLYLPRLLLAVDEYLQPHFWIIKSINMIIGLFCKTKLQKPRGKGTGHLLFCRLLWMRVLTAGQLGTGKSAMKNWWHWWFLVKVWVPSLLLSQAEHHRSKIRVSQISFQHSTVENQFSKQSWL